MIRVNVSNEEALALFHAEKLKGVKMMCKMIEDFKMNLIEYGKSLKTIESYVGDMKEIVVES